MAIQRCWRQYVYLLIGQTNDILTLNNLQLTNSGEYRLAAVNAFGSNITIGNSHGQSLIQTFSSVAGSCHVDWQD